jgi:Domain of unknown function (DUF1924)
MKKASCILLALMGSISLSVQAERINSSQVSAISTLVTKYAVKAKKEDPNATFSALDGREFYLARRSTGESDVSCFSCHSDNPAKEGKHIRTHQSIKPLAPTTNPERFTDIGKIERNLVKHCVDLYGKDCSAKQKTDFFMYLISVN